MRHPTRGGRAVAAAPTREACTTASPPPHPLRRTLSRARPWSVAATPRSRVLLLMAALLAVVALAGGCGGDSAATTGDQADRPRELSIFAAASLTEAFARIGDDFTAAHPDVEVTFNFAGSNDLVTQVRAGAPADVLATADTVTLDAAGDLVVDPRAFAANQLAIAVGPGNPKGITGLADLSRDDITLVLAAPEVPAGKYAVDVLSRAGVEVDPVSLEVTVKGVATKVALGEADAGLVFVTDIRAAAGDLDGVPIPAAENVTGLYAIAPVAASAHAEDAAAFVDFVLSPRGRRVLDDHGFLPAP